MSFRCEARKLLTGQKVITPLNIAKADVFLCALRILGG
jgi:hypothetical protein